MHSYLVALRISGPTLDVADVTAKLSLKPSQTRIAGQSRPGGKSVWDESMWEYEVRPNKNGKRDWSSLEQGLTRIVSAFRSRKRLLRNYQGRFKGKRQSRKHKLDERGILLTTDAERPRQLG
jgi:hypothetical protein